MEPGRKLTWSDILPGSHDPRARLAGLVEAGSGVGGTCYWNRSPGARFDSESWTYGYSFSQELLDDWDWEEHFAGQTTE